MPAVQAFAIYAAIATFLDYLLQISLFSGWLSLDARRMKSRRVDCFPCVAISDIEPPSPQPHTASAETSLNADPSAACMALPDARPAPASQKEVKEGYIRVGMRYYGKFLMNDCVRVMVVCEEHFVC